MENLVIIKDNKAVTDSLTVAEAFGKEHKRVLQDIRELGCSEKFRQHNFVPSSYLNSQNKEMPMYYMNRKGFTFLVMGYTGSKADEFKEAYIEQFELMEETILKNQPRVLSDREQLSAVMKLSFMQEEDIKGIKEEVKSLRHDFTQKLTLEFGQQRAIENAKKNRVYYLWETAVINTEVHDTKHKVFAAMGKDLKDAFAVNSYRDIRQKDFDEAIQYIKAWRPRIV